MNTRKLMTRRGMIIAALALMLAAGRTDAMAETKQEVATLGGGCFWCLEAVYDELQGVAWAESGYAGGQFKASYEEVVGRAPGSVSAYPPLPRRASDLASAQALALKRARLSPQCLQAPPRRLM